MERIPPTWPEVRDDGSSTELADTFDGVRERGIGSAKRRWSGVLFAVPPGVGYGGREIGEIREDDVRDPGYAGAGAL
jgi:hypothetical protein